MTDPPPAPPCKLVGRGVERSETGWVIFLSQTFSFYILSYSREYRVL